EVKLLEKVDNPRGPYGAKAVGEPPLMYGIGVFFAIRNAMHAFRPNVEFAFDSPLTPEKVLMQLHSDWLDDLTNGRTVTSGKGVKTKKKRLKRVDL
ncbi:hypothetical protein IH799_04365, partial [candidate division KSB1 bacterium]|nr:hypothetical protein [candidate division KSB1 bacterium]